MNQWQTQSIQDAIVLEYIRKLKASQLIQIKVKVSNFIPVSLDSVQKSNDFSYLCLQSYCEFANNTTLVQLCHCYRFWMYQSPIELFLPNVTISYLDRKELYEFNLILRFRNGGCIFCVKFVICLLYATWELKRLPLAFVCGSSYSNR